MSPVRRLRPLALPAIVLAVYAALAIGSSRWMSLTFDEPGHLMAAIAIAREGDYRFGPNHPPLVRLWANMPNILDPGVVLPTSEPAYREGKQLSAAIAFLGSNDSMLILRRARVMIILLAVATGGFLWWWTRRLAGTAAATAALLLFALEPNMMAHGSLMTTDMGITLTFLVTTYFLWRVAGRVTVPLVLGLAVAFAAAQLSKFSALVLWPALALVLAWRVLDPSPWEASFRGSVFTVVRRARRAAVAAGIVLVVVAVFFASVWACYGFRYAMAPDPGLGIDFTEDREFRVSERAMGKELGWLRILPEAYVRGGAQLATWPDYRYYFLGRLRVEPVWYFYPVVLLVKTPSAILILAAAGLALAARRRKRLPPGWPALAIPPLAFLAAGMASGMSTGVRHMLPLFPFLVMASGATAAWLATRRAARALLLPLALTALLEFGMSYPDTIAAFNLLSGGPRNGDRWVVDTNMDWGQGMLALKRWADEHGVKEMNVACHYTVNTEGIGFTVYQLPAYEYQRKIEFPRLPGYVAVSTSVLRGYTGGKDCADLYAPFLDRKPVARIGNSIRIYYVDKPWWRTADDPR